MRPVTALKGVGPKLAEKLARLNLVHLQDLLFHLPLRYQDRTRLTPIGALRAGMETSVRAKIELADVVFRGRRSLIVRVADGTGAINLRFFYFSGTQQAQLQRGRAIHCFGEVRYGAAGLEMVHPEYSVGEDLPELDCALTPIYPTTEGVHQASLRKLIARAVSECSADLEELLPADGAAAELALRDALIYVHAPPVGARVDLLAQGCHPAQQRLAFEELVAHQLMLRKRRERARAHAAVAIVHGGAHAQALLARLPFTLTRAQQAVLAEIEQDLRRAQPMQRLVQGDVGCGKTIVAAAAALHVVEAGLQVALMAPTELLAEQHYRNFYAWLAPLGVNVVWLAGKVKGAARAAACAEIESGRAQVVVGTHALFQGHISFAQLGLMIVDEQHRFGVDQRLALREKGNRDGRYPHQLIMSATPIPRTLAQTLYVDLDISVIDELPPGRTPVDTVVLAESRRADVVARVRDACAVGRQAYWVCALIEPSEQLELQTATETAAELTAALTGLKVGLIHGRMKPAEKEKIMQAFTHGALQLLVATTVIEVGVDVPNASLMIIENAERLGLAQLHQLRGRVGRGAAASACVLLYRAPLSQQARARLACLRETNDGFEIARKDLELRGPGEMFGVRQTGLVSLRIADFMRDQALLPDVARVAQTLVDSPAADALMQRWLGAGRDYIEV